METTDCFILIMYLGMSGGSFLVSVFRLIIILIIFISVLCQSIREETGLMLFLGILLLAAFAAAEDDLEDEELEMLDMMEMLEMSVNESSWLNAAFLTQEER